MKHILFVCIENSCRSQMAEAFAILYGQDRVHAYSAGSNPSGKVNERAVFFMKELGYDLAGHSSKSLDEIPEIEYDCVVTMGCGDACPHVKAKTRLDWNLDDPKNLSDEDFRKVRDEIKVRVKLLLAL